MAQSEESTGTIPLIEQHGSQQRITSIQPRTGVALPSHQMISLNNSRHLAQSIIRRHNAGRIVSPPKQHVTATERVTGQAMPLAGMAAELIQAETISTETYEPATPSVLHHAPSLVSGNAEEEPFGALAQVDSPEANHTDSVISRQASPVEFASGRSSRAAEIRRRIHLASRQEAVESPANSTLQTQFDATEPNSAPESTNVDKISQAAGIRRQIQQSTTRLAETGTTDATSVVRQTTEPTNKTSLAATIRRKIAIANEPESIQAQEEMASEMRAKTSAEPTIAQLADQAANQDHREFEETQKVLPQAESFPHSSEQSTLRGQMRRIRRQARAQESGVTAKEPPLSTAPVASIEQGVDLGTKSQTHSTPEQASSPTMPIRRRVVSRSEELKEWSPPPRLQASQSENKDDQHLNTRFQVDHDTDAPLMESAGSTDEGHSPSWVEADAGFNVTEPNHLSSVQAKAIENDLSGAEIAPQPSQLRSKENEASAQDWTNVVATVAEPDKPLVVSHQANVNRATVDEAPSTIQPSMPQPNTIQPKPIQRREDNSIDQQEPSSVTPQSDNAIIPFDHPDPADFPTIMSASETITEELPQVASSSDVMETVEHSSISLPIKKPDVAQRQISPQPEPMAKQEIVSTGQENRSPDIPSANTGHDTTVPLPSNTQAEGTVQHPMSSVSGQSEATGFQKDISVESGSNQQATNINRKAFTDGGSQDAVRSTNNAIENQVASRTPTTIDGVVRQKQIDSPLQESHLSATVSDNEVHRASQGVNDLTPAYREMPDAESMLTSPVHEVDSLEYDSTPENVERDASTTVRTSRAFDGADVQRTQPTGQHQPNRPEYQEQRQMEQEIPQNNLNDAQAVAPSVLDRSQLQREPTIEQVERRQHNAIDDQTTNAIESFTTRSTDEQLTKIASAQRPPSTEDYITERKPRAGTLLAKLAAPWGPQALPVARRIWRQATKDSPSNDTPSLEARSSEQSLAIFRGNGNDAVPERMASLNRPTPDTQAGIEQSLVRYTSQEARAVPIQRSATSTPLPMATLVHRSEAEPSVSAGEEHGSGPSSSTSNLDMIARQILPLIKRMLAVERERVPR